jgi:CRP/FNR family transcriptional regulator, anaerobic regulatory protein
VPSSEIRPPAAEARLMASGDGSELQRRVELRRKLALGRSKLSATFHSSSPCTLRPGELLATSAGPRDAIYLIRAGWACQFRVLANGNRAIVDVYLPGDVIGLDAVLRTRRLEEVVTLTSVTAEVIYEENALIDLMACQLTALYIAWLLGIRQRRADQLLTALLCLDARGRMATILLDFYTRLRRRRLITGLTYGLPLTQVQMGSYVGLTMVHVNRVLGSLRDERIVQVEKHCVTILALEQLKRLAEHEWVGVENSVAHVVGSPLNDIVF